MSSDSVSSGELFAPDFGDRLRHWLTAQRWFAGKARQLTAVEFEVVPLDATSLSPILGAPHGLILARAAFTSGEPDLYLIPFVALQGEQAAKFTTDHKEAVVQPLCKNGQLAMLIGDGMADPQFARGIVDLIAAVRPADDKLVAWSSDALSPILASRKTNLANKLASGQQSNTCTIFGDQMVLKVFRRLEPGINPDLEIGRYLSQQGAFRHVPELLGSLEYQTAGQDRLSIAILHRLVGGASDAWQLALGHIDEYFKRVATLSADQSPTPATAFQTRGEGRATGSCSLWKLGDARPVAAADSLAGDFLNAIRLLGQRTAELHLALAEPTDSPSFAPEPFTPDCLQSLRSSMRETASRAIQLLRERLAHLPEHVHDRAQALLDQEANVLGRFDSVANQAIDGQRIRCHGDYHLGQVLYADGDFTILDFEGEPARPLEQRRAKRSPLQDLAGMLRSFHYARSQALFAWIAAEPTVAKGTTQIRDAADAWYLWAAASFLHAYREAAAGAPYLPNSPADCDRLLSALVLEKAFYELSYELNNRPDWVEAPLDGLLGLLSST